MGIDVGKGLSRIALVIEVVTYLVAIGLFVSSIWTALAAFGIGQ